MALFVFTHRGASRNTLAGWFTIGSIEQLVVFGLRLVMDSRDSLLC